MLLQFVSDWCIMVVIKYIVPLDKPSTGGDNMQINNDQAIKNSELVTFSRLALALANDYESIYYVDTRNDHYVEYRASGENKDLSVVSYGDDFFLDVTYNVPKQVYEPDREAFLNFFIKQDILAHLEDGKAYTHNYRLIRDDGFLYYQLKVIRGTSADKDFMIVGVRNVDEQVRREQIAAAESRIYGEISMALSSRYEVIYYIDATTNKYTEYSSSHEYSLLGVSKMGRDFFITAREDIVKYIDPADCDRMLKVMDKNNLLDTLDQTGSFTCTYRQLLDGRSQYVTMHIVRPRNDNNCIVIGVLNIDKQVRREQAAIAQNETYSQIVNALAKQYEVIYYIDLETDHYKEYSSSEKYAQLRMGESGLDFFGDTKRNMIKQIYPEDLPMMEKAMDRQQFINDLNETGTTSITYRLMLDNRPQYVNLIAIRPEENPRHVIIAVSNIDAAKQREMDFRAALGNAMDMANKDALTKVKNKHAYSHAVAEMDEDIAGRRSKEFAIAVLDINGLKNINDTRGHRVGDEYIKSCCRIICTTFKHSPVFRIGGDEFAVILTGDDYENRQILSDSFKSIMQSNAQRELATLAIGIAAYDRNMDTSVATVFERADNAMYENKKIYKDR